LTSLSAEVSGLTHALHRERMRAAEFLVAPEVSPIDPKVHPKELAKKAYTDQGKVTDDIVARYSRSRQDLGSVPQSVADRLQRIDEHLATLNGSRQEVLAQQGVSVGQVLLRYGVVISDLVAYREDISPVAGNTSLANGLRAAAAFSKASVQAAEEQAVAFAALKKGSIDAEEFSSFVSTLTGQQEALVAFSLAASPEQSALVGGSVTGDAVQLADQMATEVSRAVNAQSTVTADQVSDAFGAVADLMRWAEEQLDAALIADANDLRAAVLREVVIESTVVLVTLVLAVMFALLLARSMARSLGRLREGALGVAHRDLPDAVARLRDVQSLGENSPDEIARQLRDPIALNSRDEIGQVGQAFNVVHREAVRIAAEQAALRTSVSAMFLNLARRSQTLVDRMIGELDQIERSEEDPRRLSQLFGLDHLATRMRRNDENLLVLAGADSSPPRRDDALLIDALRAAQSEVELYDRIEFGTVDTDVSVAAHAVNDVVRLVAELLDNATRFSPPNTAIVADARRVGDYVLVQIEDHGLGLSDEQLHTLNQRLSGPSTVDITSFRMMGLAVVARLASRLQIRVELRRNQEGGTVANVALPASILLLPRIRGREPIVTRPRVPLAVETGPAYARRNWAATGNADNGSVPATGDWTPPSAGPAPVSVGLHVTGAAASSAAAAANASMPVAGRGGGSAGGGLGASLAATMPTAKPAGYGDDLTRPPRVDDTTELPIFREMEAVWFRGHGPLRTDSWSSGLTPASAPPASTPMASAASPGSGGPGSSSTSPTPSAYAPPAAYAPPPVPAGSGPGDRGGMPPVVPQSRDASDIWRTAADTGWQAATAAAEPRAGGITRSGLPKRVPMGQLVPGGVDSPASQSSTRRTPEEVRGLLAAYHRGVQRGRSSGGDMSTIVEPEGYRGTSG
jgi:signal transduction histidine kinase